MATTPLSCPMRNPHIDCMDEHTRFQIRPATGDDVFAIAGVLVDTWHSTFRGLLAKGGAFASMVAEGSFAQPTEPVH